MRLRLLPVLIVTAAIALTVRVGDLWTGLGTIALAQSTSQEGSATSSRQAAASEDPIPPQVEGARIMNLPSDPFSLSNEEIDLLQSLAERRKELDLRAHQLEQREALLLAVERRIDEKVEALKALQGSIQDDNENQYKSLVKIYENMKPKDAARIFEELEMAILLPVAERMKERKLAAILAKMATSKARVLTSHLAHRRTTGGQQAMGSDQLPGGLAPAQ